MAARRAARPGGAGHRPGRAAPVASTPPSFAAQRIRAIVDAIPPGCVASYGQVAREAGLVGRARMVGRVLGQLPSASALPWHRVLLASGRIAARGSCSREQARRLRAEGVRVDRSGRVDLRCYGWSPDWS